jgi:hypothetical protein
MENLLKNYKKSIFNNVFDFSIFSIQIELFTSFRGRGKKNGF